MDGRAVPLPGARQRLVLTMLLVDFNRMVPAGRLIDELWEAALPADPRGALRTQVSRLRRALGPAGGDLATVEGGYRLAVQRGQLDATRFEDMLAEAARASSEQALGLVDEALAVWRGPAIGDFADRPFALATVARLNELRLVAAERRAELLLIAGLAEEAAATLQALLAEHPEREQARGLFMQALYRAGRHTEALSTFRTWRRYLAEELGLDPSPALRRIEQDILCHTAGALDTRGEAVKPTPMLPVPVTSFIDLRAAHSWLADTDPELGLQMAAQLHWYALWRCHSEVYRWADASTAGAAGSRSPFYPEALASAAFGAVYRGDMQAADAAARAAFDAARSLPPISARRPLEALAEVATFRGELAAAVDLYTRAYDLSIGNGDFRDAAWDAVSASAAYAYGGRLGEASRLADQARAAADRCRSPSALALVSWLSGEIAIGTSPGQARHHLQRAVALATSAGSRFVEGLSRVALATLNARHGDATVALGHYERAIHEWQQAGAWTPMWVTMRTLVELLTRAGAWHDAAILYGAVTSASNGAPPFGADADRLRQSAALLRQHLADTEFRVRAEKGEQMDGSQVIHFALEAIARAATKP